MTWSKAALDAINQAVAEGRATVDGKPVPLKSLENSNPAIPIDEVRDFMPEVIRYARSRGWLVYHPYDSRKSQAGFPDLFMVRKGVIVIAELKVDDNKPTADQQTWLDELHRVEMFGLENGGLGLVEVHLWYPKDWPEIARVLS